MPKTRNAPPRKIDRPALQEGASAAFEVKSDQRGVSFAVRIAPRASRSAITGVHGGALKISVASPPVDGEANAELCALLAKRLGVPKRNVVITQGERGKSKVVCVSGVTEEAVRELGDG